MKKHKSVLFAALALFLVPVAVPAQELPPADWPQAGRNAQRTGYSPDAVLSPFKSQWSVSFFPDRVHTCAGVIVSENRVFIGTKSGILHALDLSGKGKELWSFKCGGPILHSAAAAGGKVVFASLDGCVYALDAAGGAPAWKTDTGAGFSCAPLIAEDSVMIGNRGGSFFRLALADGAVIWKRELGAPVFQTAAYNDGRVYVGAEDMVMRALSAGDGTEAWNSGKLQGQSFKDYWPVVHNGYVCVRPQIVTIDFRILTDFPPLTWGADEATVREAFNAFPGGKPLPAPFREAEQKLVEFYRGNPQYRETYFLNEKTGKEDFITPIQRLGALGGPIPPPCVLSDGLLAVPTATRGGVKFGAFDLDSRSFVDIWPAGNDVGGGVDGNADETYMASSAGDMVFACHYNGGRPVFDRKTRKWSTLPQTPRMLSNLVNGANQAVVVAPYIVHVSHGTVTAWTGAP